MRPVDLSLLNRFTSSPTDPSCGLLCGIRMRCSSIQTIELGHNRFVAASVPWTARRRRASYRELGADHWLWEMGTLPELPASIAEEARRIRRSTFWGHFLMLPEQYVIHAPQVLLPSDQSGRFHVRWFHRLYWQTVRRLIALPLISFLLCGVCGDDGQAVDLLQGLVGRFLRRLLRVPAEYLVRPQLREGCLLEAYRSCSSGLSVAILSAPAQ